MEHPDESVADAVVAHRAPRSRPAPTLHSQPASTKQNDSKLTIDPYRSVYGVGQGALAALILGSIAAFTLVVAIVVAALR